jgi:hypothetical protein
MVCKRTKEKRKMNKTLSTCEAAGYLMHDENANWSPAGAFALVEYLEEMEEGCDMAIEMDVVAIRCDYSEYSSLIEWAREYFADWTAEFSGGPEDDESVDEYGEKVDDEIREYIQERGQLIEFGGGIIVSDF